MTRYTATIRGTTFAGSLADLSRAYSRIRDESGEGASTFPTAMVLDERNHTAGFIGYNGRIWADNPAHVRGSHTAQPIYDNRAPFRLADANTRFALPIICPKTREEVSAETLYNRCCDDLGRVVRDHIGDLILDNFNYDANPAADDKALMDAVYAWAADVHRQLSAAER